MTNDSQERIYDILNRIAKTFDDEYEVDEGEEFSATFSTKLITYTLDVFTADFYFIQDMYRRGGTNMPLLSNILCSFLHEIGHLETEDLIVNDIKQRNEYSGDNYSVLESFESYCELYNERIATQWAIDYILSNRTVVCEWDKQIRNRLSNG